MPFFPPMISVAPLQTALLSWLEPPHMGPMWFEGPARLRHRLLLREYQLQDNRNAVRQILWVNTLPLQPQAAVEKLRRAREVLLPGGRILVAQPALSTEERGIFSQLWLHLGGYRESTTLTTLFLQAQLAPIIQIWPQGMRSWLLTLSAPGLPISHVFPAKFSCLQTNLRPGGTQ